MSTPTTARLSRDFWVFFFGQTVSNLGSSVTLFALPLLVYRLTGSALNLALISAMEFLPYLLFGLLIGAWVDRVNRKRLMVLVNIGSALALACIPLLDAFGALQVGWVYAVGFITATLAIAFNAAEFAAIPSLVPQDNLVAANGRIQASYSAAQVLGPLLAGGLAALLPLPDLLLFDAASFLVSAGALLLIRRSFNAEAAPRTTSIRQDIAEGLRYVVRHPVLRNISLMMALVNFFASTIMAQAVLFAKDRLHATDPQLGVLFASGSLGVVALALLAGPIRQRLPFSRAALGALMVSGLLAIGLSQVTSYWPAVLLWALWNGFGILFNINTSSLRQALVPNALLGRVISIAGVLAWSAIPLGTLLGGYLIERIGVAAVFLLIGLATTTLPLVFAFTALGRAEQFLEPINTPPVAEPQPSSG